MKSVTEQLQTMTEKCAVKSANHPKFSSWFAQSGGNIVNTRSLKSKYKRVTARTDRYAASAISTMTAILNARDLEEQERSKRKQQELSRSLPEYTVIVTCTLSLLLLLKSHH